MAKDNGITYSFWNVLVLVIVSFGMGAVCTSMIMTRVATDREKVEIRARQQNMEYIVREIVITKTKAEVLKNEDFLNRLNDLFIKYKKDIKIVVKTKDDFVLFFVFRSGQISIMNYEEALKGGG